jgi:hypothetical protein
MSEHGWEDEDEVITNFRSLKQGMGEAAEQERLIILGAMQSYFELTQFSQEVEGAPANSEWDRGYQAAMAIAKGTRK